MEGIKVNRIKSRIAAEVELDKISLAVAPKGDFEDSWKWNFDITTKDDASYHCVLEMDWDKLECKCVWIRVIVKPVRYLKVVFDLNIWDQNNKVTKVNNTETSENDEIFCSDNDIKLLTYFWRGLQQKREPKSISGKLLITFEPAEEKYIKEAFIKSYSSLKSLGDFQIEDFTIVCENDKKIKFNKELLIEISPVFKNMLQHSRYKEGKNTKEVKIIDTSANVIEAFKRVYFDDNIKRYDLTPELYMFAHEYEIHQLSKICREQICKTINKKNLLEISKAATRAKDRKLLKFAMKFMKRNFWNIKINSRWDEFLENNPDFLTKVGKMPVQKSNTDSNCSDSDSDSK